MPTNDYSKNIVYLSKEQYQELITNETLTVNGQTITYNDNDIYVTPQAEPITDVRMNGTSISNNGIANIPVAGNGNSASSTLGVVRGGQGIKIVDGGVLSTDYAYVGDVKNGTSNYLTISPKTVPEAAFFGLSKVAGVDLKNETVTLGIYPDSSKAAIQNMLGITDLISTEETSTATAAHALNSTFMMNGKLHRATAAITIGDAVEVGTNCEVVKADEVFVKKTDIAGNTGTGIYGIVRISEPLGVGISNGYLYTTMATDIQLKAGENAYTSINPKTQHKSIYYGLSKLAGVDLASETVTVGTYPETSKTAIRAMLGAAAASDIPTVPVQDVQVNGTSILSQDVANVPVASESDLGVVGINSSFGIYINASGKLYINGANSDGVKAGTGSYRPLTPSLQHASTFYGLAKAAGDSTQSASSNAVGTYTSEAQAAIRSMLGAASPNVIAVQDTQPTNSETKVWLPETQAAGVEVPTYEEFQALDSSVVKKTDIAPSTGSNVGLVRIYNAQANGITVDNDGTLRTQPASDGFIKSGSATFPVITPSNLKQAVFYGLAKASGDTTQQVSSNAVGTYTNDAKAAIQTMLGVPGDVQVNGTSVVSNGVANIPIARDTLGAVKISGYGFTIRNDNNCLSISAANNSQIKTNTNWFNPIVPANKYLAVFYGLAEAAGDTTQLASSNTVGTYTTEALAAIHTMLGINPAAIAAQVEIPLVETVTGTTPSITGQPNTRYNCGEVSTLSITPPASGSIDVIFESGSTPTVITVPNTVKWPAWFDATALEADTTYEILITDGVYGSVMTWAT